MFKCVTGKRKFKDNLKGAMMIQKTKNSFVCAGYVGSVEERVIGKTTALQFGVAVEKDPEDPKKSIWVNIKAFGDLKEVDIAQKDRVFVAGSIYKNEKGGKVYENYTADFIQRQETAQEVSTGKKVEKKDEQYDEGDIPF